MVSSWTFQDFPTRLSTCLYSSRKFAQAAHSKKKPERQNVIQKAGRSLPNTDSKLGQEYLHKIKTAGRKGSKRFVDPCKVFIGNMPFSVDDAQFKDLIVQQLGLPAHILMHKCNIIREWKTGKSKGYGFVDFIEPIHATVCVDKMNGMMLDGRMLSVGQGKKKEQSQVFVKKKKTPAVTDEEEAIASGVEEVDSPLEELDPEAIAMIRRLDPDLLEDFKPYDVDEDLMEDEDDDDDEGVDGIWEEDDDDDVVVFDEDGFTQPMNREQRRDAARRTKRKKLPHKGFGEAPPGY